jgi:hypothetical protein
VRFINPKVEVFNLDFRRSFGVLKFGVGNESLVAVARQKFAQK